MTDKEKAKNIGKVNARQYRHNYGGEEFVFSNEECETSALEMAEWKDQQTKESFKKFYDKGLSVGKSVAKQQFKKYLEEKRNRLVDDHIDCDCRLEYASCINEIINELFKEDRR